MITFCCVPACDGNSEPWQQEKRGGGNLSIVVPGSEDELEEENCTDSLASSIRSVTLASTPMTVRGSPPDSLWTPRVSTRESRAVPPPRSKHQLRRRRQSLDGSGSSTEDGSDASGIRRKRSNTTTSPPPTLKAQSRGNIRRCPRLVKSPIEVTSVCRRRR